MLELNKIYNMDCIEGMKLIPDNSIDLIFTDPPYKVISWWKPKHKWQPSWILSKNDWKIFAENNIDIKDYIYEFYRILKEWTHCYIMTNNINLESFLTESKKAWFWFHNLLIRKKNNKTPNRRYMKNIEYIIFLRKWKAKKINSSDWQILEFNNIIWNKIHPTEKPVALVERIILNSSEKWNLVFDPFMWSWTTAIACLNTNRNFIWFELDKWYREIANKRLENRK